MSEMQPVNPVDSKDDEVSKTTFHRLLVYLDRWSTKPVWLLIIFLLLLVVLVGMTWFIITGEAASSLMAAGLLAFFIAADAILFNLLPVLSISFGPWKPQLVALLVPRMVISLFAAFLSLFVGPSWAILLMAVLELCFSFILFWGSVIEVHQLSLSRVEVRISSFDGNKQPIRILQISDLHVERHTRRESKLSKIVKHIKPDIIVLTGDYLNLSYTSDIQSQNEVKNILRQLKAPGGVYATLGGPTVDDRSVAPHLFDDVPIRLMKNEWEEVRLSGNRSVVLLGLDCSQNLDEDAASLMHLAKTSPNSSPRVLLYHTPDLMPQAVNLEIDLYLCGHTHGGQVRLPLYGAILTSSRFGKKYEMGWYQEGKTILYVSRGVGLEGLGAPRMRFLSPPEITLFTLTADSPSAPKPAS